MKSWTAKYFDLLRYDRNGNRIEIPWFMKSKKRKKKKNNGQN
jgi:hypothetical protein